MGLMQVVATGQLIRFDSFAISGVEILPSGARRIRGVAAVVGVMDYRRKDGSTQREMVTLDALHSSVPTMKGAVLTLEHPREFVNPSNFSKVAVGFVEDAQVVDDARLEVVLLVHDARGVKAIEDGVRELSPGYYAMVVPAPPGETRFDTMQIRREVNHLALTRAGRAGKQAALIMDSDGNVRYEVEPMSEPTPKNDSALEDKLVEQVEANAQLKVENTQLKAQVDAKDVEIADLQAKLDAQPEAPTDEELHAEFLKKFTERTKLVDSAARIGAEVDPQATNAAIKKAVVQAKYGDKFRADADEAYIDASYDLIVDSLPEPNSQAAASEAFFPGGQRQTTQPKADADGDDLPVVDPNAAFRKFAEGANTKGN